MLAMLAGAKMVHIPYRGAAPALNDLLAGTIDLFFTSPPTIVGQVQSGMIRALAIASKQRHPILPNVPTTAELGFPGFEVDAWFGVYAPAKTPKPIIDKLTIEIKALMETPEFRNRVEELGSYPTYMPPDEFAAFTAAQIEHWSKAIKAAGITLD